MERRDDFSRALLFGSVADDYERYRLGYPDEVVDAVLTYAGRPVEAALEVGAGTGKATRVFAARGISVTAIEPDADMARVLRTTSAGLGVTTAVARFEDFRADARFDLVYAAASWHWTDPKTRWRRAADLLVPGGVLALFGRPGELQDPGLTATVQAIERGRLPEDDRADVHPWSVEELAAADGFIDVEERMLTDAMTPSSDDYVGRLATVSAYLLLEPEERAEALRQLRTALPDEVEVGTTVHLVMARRM